MNLTDSRLAQAGNERLELAMLSFFEQFRKIYIGDQVQKSSKVKKTFSDAAFVLDPVRERLIVEEPTDVTETVFTIIEW